MNQKTILFFLTIIFSSLILTGCDSFTMNSPRQSNCPQINVPITQEKGRLPFIGVREYDGWKIAPTDFRYYLIKCHLGSKQGQNPNNLYCGDSTSLSEQFESGFNEETTSAFMQKTLMNKDGTIGETIKQRFINIYEQRTDQEIKEICHNDTLKNIKEGIWEISLLYSNGTRYTKKFECGIDEYMYVFQKTVCGQGSDEDGE